MKVTLAKSAGFCYGVRRALDTVLEAAKVRDMPMFTLGPLIHNPQVIERLESYGIKSVKGLDEVPSGSILIMPSHGVPKEVKACAEEMGLEIIDVTCPFVAKVHRLAEKLVKEGYQVVVLGDKDHTEVRGIMSVCSEGAVAVSSAQQLEEHNLSDKVGVVSQTTQTSERLQDLVAGIVPHAHEVRSYNTICDATVDRQEATLELIHDVDVMVVVGGRNSANTGRLAQICSETGIPTYHVEIADEVDDSWFSGVGSVGVTAGASTPDWVIDEVVEKIKGIDK